MVLGKRNAGVELSTYPGVSALCVALRAQAMATWQSPHTRFRPGFPHAAALHPGQTNLARVGAALPFGVPFTGAGAAGADTLKSICPGQRKGRGIVTRVVFVGEGQSFCGVVAMEGMGGMGSPLPSASFLRLSHSFHALFCLAAPIA